ncbi:TOMM precursor leader peptide-binding protein [Actinacidiphila rubida]|uniref:Bacteriocin biosynthesis cyclodehydratase domain-containing protein n=1 Tax=Actinacidiphila rubida TaxID=310780 RepID=A0A1H8RDU7_9ACTN|nr:TOMM precursor leader peptide-binding protein [Actinacidiphila rubida]SEO64689.1 bacteriocin biosynthesis cyclodehydratase domain-containing protein [Actinacidiphila rubida]
MVSPDTATTENAASGTAPAGSATGGGPADPARAAAAADAAYAKIAGTRPRIRRDVLYTQTPTGVHFHNARGGFSVVMPSAYRFASLIVPHLTGDTTVEGLCQGLGTKQRDMVTRLVSTLYARGFARDAVPPAEGAPVPEADVARRFAPQIDYVDHYTDGAAERFLRFRTSRVAVLGDDEVARWAALSLIRNGCAAVAVTAGVDTPGHRFSEVRDEAAELAADGCPVELRVLEPGTGPGGFGWDDLDGYDVVLVTGEQAARQSAALSAAVPAGRMLVPAWEFGGAMVVGPLTAEDSPGCWRCAALRLSANGDPAHAADLWSALAPGAPRPAPGTARGPVAAMIGNLLGYEVFRLTTGALPAETRGQVVVQDLDSLDTVAERLLPHPACPDCAAPPAPAAAAFRLDALDALDAAEDRADRTEGEPAEEDAAKAALAEITDRAVLVQQAAGVFRSFDDEVWAQTPLKVSTVVLSTGHGAARPVTAFDVHHVAGARLRALCRAAEVYAEHVVPLPEVLTGAALDAARAKWATAAADRLAVDSGLGVQDVAAWCATASLLGGETVLVPAAALRPFGPYNRDRVVEPTSAGTGAGRTPEEATARAVLTALAHDTLREALHGRVPVASVDPAALEDAGDPELTFLVRSAATLAVPVEILDLGAPGARAVPVVLARSGGRWAVGSALRWREAALEALRDLLGAVQLAAEPQAPEVPDTGDPLLAELAPASLGVTGSAAPAVDAGTTWAGVAESLRASGRDLLAAPVHAPDLGAGLLHATRVLLTRGGAVDAR